MNSIEDSMYTEKAHKYVKNFDQKIKMNTTFHGELQSIKFTDPACLYLTQCGKIQKNNIYSQVLLYIDKFMNNQNYNFCSYHTDQSLIENWTNMQSKKKKTGQTSNDIIPRNGRERLIIE